MKIRSRFFAAGTSAVLSLVAATVQADERTATVPPLPHYQQECASCHIAYPPGLLPASSWQRLIDGLSHHFGTDASVEAAVAAELSAWLTTHAAKRSVGADPPAEDRITRSRWFVREHRKVPAPVWQHAAVGTKSNCAACHRDAARGDFDDDSVMIPR
jgi:hypothetical protein